MGGGVVKVHSTALGQHAAGGRFRPGRDGDVVFGCLGQAVDQRRIVLEGQRARRPASARCRAAPARCCTGTCPAARSADGRQRHHRLVEGDAEEGGDRDFPFGRKAQHLQRAGFDLPGPGAAPGWAGRAPSPSRPVRGGGMGCWARWKSWSSPGCGVSSGSRARICRDLIRAQRLPGGYRPGLHGLRLGLALAQADRYRQILTLHGRQSS